MTLRQLSVGGVCGEETWSFRWECLEAGGGRRVGLGRTRDGKRLPYRAHLDTVRGGIRTPVGDVSRNGQSYLGPPGFSTAQH